MLDQQGQNKRKASLRQRILFAVGALVILSLAGSTVSLYRITEVNNSLRSLNQVVAPLERAANQLRTDTDVMKRELARGLGYPHWKDPAWKPRPIPRWIADVLDGQLARIGELVHQDGSWTTREGKRRWVEWSDRQNRRWDDLRRVSASLYQMLEQKNHARATEVYPEWIGHLEDWTSDSEWAVREAERMVRQMYSESDQRVADLRTALKVILFVVILLSFLLLWFGERALRPLERLTALARDIKERGLRKEDRESVAGGELFRDDEVSELAREFRGMATALLEREKMIESQKGRLEEQNQQLQGMLDLQKRLQAAEEMAALGRLSAQVAHEVRNPLHSIGLEAEMALEEVTSSGDHRQTELRQSLQSILNSVDRLEKITDNYLKLSRLSDGEMRVYDLGEIVESVLATYSVQCEKQSVSVDWSRQSGVPLRVRCDRDLLEQAIGNLFRNALQALEGIQSPKIQISLGAAESGRVWLRIEDNGPGIASEVKDRLFTPFVTTKAQGTGLGLSFIKKVVEDHGGEVSLLKSERGAAFQVILPGVAEKGRDAKDSEEVGQSV